MPNFRLVHHGAWRNAGRARGPQRKCSGYSSESAAHFRTKICCARILGNVLITSSCQEQPLCCLSLCCRLSWRNRIGRRVWVYVQAMVFSALFANVAALFPPRVREDRGSGHHRHSGDQRDRNMLLECRCNACSCFNVHVVSRNCSGPHSRNDYISHQCLLGKVVDHRATSPTTSAQK